MKFPHFYNDAGGNIPPQYPDTKHGDDGYPPIGYSPNGYPPQEGSPLVAGTQVCISYKY